ncbi:asparagine synthase (glutamine-hydrolyzing) [Desulfosporosinus orientis DSM 765]|uniref:asparagine synthase (glutamine-hydrolyzing) n=1 Tax=Desulfosporosinus orientis (strain ATCC 19365 / DSM 765 / NCIMB 8382 / VKM B-1628 / Singapore I) TaxID=768706 RepID=G7WJQ7_DESOD|nr:asparagine synthase-related protein [Desulfosporosinus orientis]AET70494.1 asparagine synthase (glutamine-hydrolyzing) [Desulfosporosinus orientis DSM 765]
MGAICGIYNRKNGPISEEICSNIMEIIQGFPHDTSHSWKNGSVFLGNTNVHITPEAENEELPKYDKPANIVLAADAIIDNRSELISILNLPYKETAMITDSDLILKAYLRWGTECSKYLIGDYAFAIWDNNKKELFCVRDHVGKRTFYFYMNKDIFAFCTIMKPLLIIKGNQSDLNQEWIANYLSLLEPLHELNITSTIYKDIVQLPPAHSISITKKGTKIKKYWDPLMVKKLKLNTDQEYEEAFRNVFFEAVNCRLRGNGNIGVMLSGGLDSGSLACIAAKNMAESGKVLKTYTSIPFPEYKNWLGNNSLADERDFVQSIIDRYNNIDFKFCDSKGINSYNSLNRLMNLLEHPFKFTANFFWMDNIASQCSKDGCSILLDGQSGNFTVSFGDLTSFVITMVRRGKWLTALQEIRSYSVVLNRNQMSVLKYFLVLMLPEKFTKKYRRVFRKRNNKNEQEPKAPINFKLSTCWKTDELLKKLKLGKYYTKNQSLYQIRKFIANSLLFSQAGEAETKLSLAYGIIKRDPTRDKRVIEFCMSLPAEQFVKDGIERSLIRRAMKGILPEKIRLNYRVRGTQSADWIQRLLPEWKELKNELLTMLENDALKRYIDLGVVEDSLKKIDELPKDEDYYEVLTFMNIIALGRFFSHNQYNPVNIII